MEVHPCLEQYVGESDYPPQNPGSDFMCKEKANSIEHDIQLQNSKDDDIMAESQGPESEEPAEGRGSSERASLLDCQLEVQNLSSGFQAIQNRDIVQEISINDSLMTSGEIPNSGKGESPRNNDEDLFLDSEWLDHDEPLAVWVKCDENWQAGIRCAKSDCPVSFIKAKPIHKTMKQFVVFLPQIKNYVWVDVSLTRPIDELPKPIVYRTHDAGREQVKDVSIPHIFIMQKLAFNMLNIIEKLHPKGLKDTAHDVIALKEFALESSRCTAFPHLGGMLVKLHNSFMSSEWLKNLSHSWMQRCLAADTAQSVEALTEELSCAILWNEVESISNETFKAQFSYDWKNAALKLFSVYNPVTVSKDHAQHCIDEPWDLNVQGSRKRPKLEIRRGEVTSSYPTSQNLPDEIPVHESDFVRGEDNGNSVTLASESFQEQSVNLENGTQDLTMPANQWVDIVVQADSVDLSHAKDGIQTPINQVVDRKSSISKVKDRQCAAFIEAKGRQCVRFANDGDIYCCIHLTSRFVGNSVKSKSSRSVDNPICGGITTLGSRCKHRSLNGSTYCKKHGAHTDASLTSTTADNYLKRKLEDSVSSAVNYSFSNEILKVKDERPPYVHQDSVRGVQASNGLQSTSGAVHSDTSTGSQLLHCVGLCSLDANEHCPESPKRHSLYCDMHLPNWLKRARSGKSRIISKDVFMDILRNCSSLEQKKQLHRACELFYRVFKSILSVRNPVPMEAELQWALSEASKDVCVRGFLMKLISIEKERLQAYWGFQEGQSKLVSLLGGKTTVEKEPAMPSPNIGYHDVREIIKCKICSAEFFDDPTLGAHWMERHKKESIWLFRGYGCAICLDSFTNKKILESHIQENHQKYSIEQYTLLQCILCDSHFGNSKDLWSHVLSCHPAHLKLSVFSIVPSEKQPQKQSELNVSGHGKKSRDNQGSARRFICRFCGLKFNLLPDLGRHHQAAHMGQMLPDSHPSKAGIHYYALKLKAGRLKHTRLKKSLSSYQKRNRDAAKMKHRIQAKLTSTEQTDGQVEAQHVAHFERLGEPQCSEVAKLLFSKVQKSKPRPSSQEILSVARSTCCKENLQSFLEARYGVVPKKMYLIAAKLCSECSIEIKWHLEGFVCPNGCQLSEEPTLMRSDIEPRLNEFVVSGAVAHQVIRNNKDCDIDEGHYLIGLSYFSQRPLKTVVWQDISFGKESIPIPCVIDRDVTDLFSVLPDGSYCQKAGGSMPWDNFTYVTKPIVDEAVDREPKGSQLRCNDEQLMCSSSTCDQVHLFNSEYEDARDIYGKPMHGRFPYDDQRCIVLEEGYLVYECNHMCDCGKTCPNRVLQNGVQVNVEVFRMKETGWTVRAGQTIRRGTFICEYVGEILKEQEAIKRVSSYDEEGCSYMYKIDPQANDISRISGGQESFVIDATKYGNVSRFIKHSSSPNLMNYQVLVESTDCQLAHIGFYSNRDIRMGEELTYNFQNGSLMGKHCTCKSSLCKGRSIC